MARTNVDQLDLNLLFAFEALYLERNVTRAGARIHLSQPSMSNALVRLRERCGDQLFVRTQGGMEPTPFATRLAAKVMDALSLIRSGLEDDGGFDPATSERSFNLLMSDFSQFIVLPDLAARFKDLAPRASLFVLPIPRPAYREALESGKADLAIGHLPELQTGFYQHGLFSDSHVCLLGKFYGQGDDVQNKTLARSRITLKQYLSARHLVVSGSMTDTDLDRTLGAKGHLRHVAMRVPNYLVIERILMKSDLMVSVPAALANILEFPKDIASAALPFHLPYPHVRQFWHARFHQDQANKWLRQQVASLGLVDTVGARVGKGVPD